MLALAGALKLQATSADRSVLEALDYVRRRQAGNERAGRVVRVR